MSNSACDVEWAGEHWSLLAERAVYWAKEKTLIIADPHFGKDASFRQHGIPVPCGTTERDVMRLESLAAEYDPETLLILGDFFHGKHSRNAETDRHLREWRMRSNDLRVINIKGNHDRHAGDPPDTWRIEVVYERMKVGSIEFDHFPEGCADMPRVAGHIHPGVSLRGMPGSGGKRPCFWLTDRLMVLPAFGGFTGRGSISPRSNDRIFVLDRSEIFELRLRG